MRPDRDLTRFTPAEFLVLWRWHVGLTQADAAARLRIGRTALSAAENTPQTAIRPPRGWDGPVTGAALLALARRRYGRGLRATAALVGVSHRTLIAWERRADDRLGRFWAGRGFRLN